MKFKSLFILLILAICTLPAMAQGEYYWQQHVAYEMDITIDVENHQYDGWQRVVYTNNSPDTLHRMFYHLYFNAFQPGSMMDVRSRTIADPDPRVGDRIYHLTNDEIGYHEIESLTQNGEPVEYKMDGTILEVSLNESILPGEEIVLEMEWNSQIPLQIRRSGWNSAEGVEFSMTQWYPKITEYDDDGWHPNPYIGREFYGVYGSFDVSITIDSDYLMGATGYLQNPNEIGYGYQDEGVEVEHGNETLTWHWEAERVHDFAWAADRDYTHTTTQVPNGPTLHFIYQTDPVAENAEQNTQEELLNYWQELPRYTVDAFQYMSENFGKYPRDKFTVIQGGDGGMEYPMITLVTGNRSLGSLVGVTVHELIHMWYYSVLGTNESRFAWMDEGFTTYASALTMNHIFEMGREYPQSGNYQSYFRLHEAGMYEALDTHADHFTTNRAYGAVYHTGAVFLSQLSYIVGQETFQEGMNRYFNVWKFKHPDGRDFLRVMEHESDMVLDWYYKYFIESAKTIDYGINSVQMENDSTVISLERIDLTPMPIDLMVTYNDGSKELFYIPLRIMRNIKENSAYPDIMRTAKPDWSWVNTTYTFKIPESISSIERIEIDPSQRLADVNRENNSWDMENGAQVNENTDE